MNRFLGFIAIAAMTLTLASCGASKKTISPDEEIVNTPFSGPEYASDKNYYRSEGIGLSIDISMAKRAAELDARTQIAGQITATIKSVMDRYAQQVNIEKKSEFEAKTEEMTRQVINQRLNNSNIKNSQLTFNKRTKKYTSYVLIEMPKDSVCEALEGAITSDERLKLDFDKYQFKKIFDEEMEKYVNGR